MSWVIGDTFRGCGLLGWQAGGKMDIFERPALPRPSLHCKVKKPVGTIVWIVPTGSPRAINNDPAQGYR